MFNCTRGCRYECWCAGNFADQKAEKDAKERAARWRAAGGCYQDLAKYGGHMPPGAVLPKFRD